MIINLARANISPRIEIDEDVYFTLSIENPQFLFKILSELKAQINGTDGEFILSSDTKTLNLEKNADIITDFTDVSLNSKTVTNLVAKRFAEFLAEGEQLESVGAIETLVCRLAEDFRLKSGLNVEYDVVMNANNLSKACNLHIADRGRTLIERLCDYVSLISELKPLKLMCLVFAKNFLTDTDIQNLYRHCYDRGARLLFVEGKDATVCAHNEHRLIIDSDLCSIPINIQ